MNAFHFDTLIPDLQVEVLKNCDISELVAFASSSKRCKDLTKNDLIWQQLYQSTFNLHTKTSQTWYETYLNRIWATKLLTGSGVLQIKRLKTIDPQTWHVGSARRVQACVQPIIVTPDEFNQIPPDIRANNKHIIYENNYYFVPINEERFKNVRVIIRQGKAYPSLSRR